VAAHDVAPERVSAFPVLLVFHCTVFKIAFLQIFTLKCILWSEAKLKIRHSSTTFTMVGRDFVQAIEQERHANLANISAPVNRNKAPSKAFFTKNFSKFQMPINSKVVCLEILHIFFLWVVLRCSGEFWRTCQSSRMATRGQRG
jgi:hypothetical protein